MQKINIDKQTIIFFALAVLLLAEVFVLVPWSFKRITVLSRTAASLSRKLKSIRVDWPNKDKYIDSQEELKAQIKKAHFKFIPSQEESKLLSFISANSKNFNVNIKSLLPGKVKEYTSTHFGEFKYLPIAVKARGGFHNLAKFLDYLKNSQYFFEIKKMSISSQQPYNFIEMNICGVISEN